MNIRRYESDLLLSNMYVVEEEGHAVVLDPFRNITAIQGLTVDRIILTHEHYDHISGVNLLHEVTHAPVFCSKICAENIQNPRKNLADHFKDFCELQSWIALDEIPDLDPQYKCKADMFFEQEVVWKWREHNWFLFEMPGHSMGSIGILLDGVNFFSGDSLMENNEIELRIPGGSKKQWKEIGKPRLEQLPNGIRVYPGHFSDFIYQKKEGKPDVFHV